MTVQRRNYGTALLAAFEYLLEKYPEVFILGQGLWSPWYVGNSMTDLDKKFGVHRVIDTPVSESATTGAAIGAALAGMKPIVVHPRMDFMLYAMDAVVNQASKWSHMFGGQAGPAVTIRSIINRGGEQGAQHSQSLHAWLAHVPGLRVVMPATVADARDLLIASVLCPDPVVFIDDRWLYEVEGDVPDGLYEVPIGSAAIRRSGKDITLVATSYMAAEAAKAVEMLAQRGIDVELIDLRSIKPWDRNLVYSSVGKTGRLVIADAAWMSGGKRNVSAVHSSGNRTGVRSCTDTTAAPPRVGGTT